ncbi:MAG: KH domain-containing protein [Actinobacteria bacterium]|nr:KH domain-containing protein [Actinomycetota bacterium]
MGVEPPKDVRELCEDLVLGVGDEPDAVKVTVEMTDEAIVLRIVVAPEDRGKVIGRGGRVVRAIRSVVRAGAVKSGRRVLVEVDESPAAQPA